MRSFYALLLLAFSAAAATADDKADCQDGIDYIRVEMAKQPAAEVLDVLQEALEDAERELGEEEYDECFEAIEDARIAVEGE